MKKFLALLLALVMVLSLAACGGEAAPAEDDNTAPVEDGVEPAGDASDPDYEQLVALTQALVGVEESMGALSTMRDGLLDGSITEEQALSAYDAVNQQAAAVYTTVGAVQWQGDAYAEEIELLNQAAEAMALYADNSYQAMAGNDAAALEEAAPLLDTYMTQMDALLTALGA